MKSKLINDGAEKTFALIFDKGDEVSVKLLDFAKENKLSASHFTLLAHSVTARSGSLSASAKTISEFRSRNRSK